MTCVRPSFRSSEASSEARASLEPLLHAIRTFLSLDTPMSLTAQVRAMVRSGDTLGAVKLLRAAEGVSLADAERRVAEIGAA